MFISACVCSGSAHCRQIGGGGGDNPLVSFLLPFALILVIMYFLIMRPQQKRQKQHADMVKNIRRGDTVITLGRAGRQGHQGDRRRKGRG